MTRDRDGHGGDGADWGGGGQCVGRMLAVVEAAFATGLQTYVD